ncbi:MAG TPA: hypothetical protein VKY73_04090, partial [Polyangiaceae bacterium]|nr:hypothetical protein [Polyangiaceae bacterium]
MARIGARSVAVLAVCLVTALARAGRATETEIHGRLAWVLGDADLTRPARSSAPSSRGLVAGDQPGYALFFDGLAARDRARQSRLELALSRQQAFVEARAFAVLALDLDLEALLARSEPEPTLDVEDAGTRLGVTTGGPGGAVTIELYPFDTDGLRLGRLRELDFGATDTRRGESSFFDVSGGVPGARVVVRRPSLRVELVGKVARARAPSEELLLGALARLAFVPTSALSLEVSGGFVQHPSALTAAGRGFSAHSGLRVALFGARVRALAPRGFPARRRERASSGLGLALEGAGLVQRLDDADRPLATRLEPGWALAVTAVYAAPRVETWLSVWARSLSFVLRHGPGLSPGRSVPRRGHAENELSAALFSRVRGL